MREFVDPEIMSRYDTFMQTPTGQLVLKTVDDMSKSLAYTPAPTDFDNWNKAMAERRDFVGGLLVETAAKVRETAVNKLAAARSSFILFLSLLGAFVLIAIGLMVAIASVLSGAIRTIGQRMTALAEGDADSAIPYVTRKDEIGGMARSVEVFRESAIRNRELEAGAEANRAAAERQRAEAQKLAEAEAEERLAKATGALATGLKRLASGDLLCEINEQFAPQFEALRHDFNASVSQLRDALVAVGQSATVVTSGSGEISQASDNLAKRTEQQAASLEETAAALEEITANVTATSKRTGDARDLVRDTKTRAEKSGIVVSNAVTAMEKIEHSSRQIGQIIGVIDENRLPDQPSGAECRRRGGPCGRGRQGLCGRCPGVRELAQRSANAAKEIKSLIGNSEVAVSEGVKLVNDTGEGLTAIAQLVQAIKRAYGCHRDGCAGTVRWSGRSQFCRQPHGPGDPAECGDGGGNECGRRRSRSGKQQARIAALHLPAWQSRSGVAADGKRHAVGLGWRKLSGCGAQPRAFASCAVPCSGSRRCRRPRRSSRSGQG